MNEKDDIKSWWSENPMTYADTHGDVLYGDESFRIGTREFFERVDREFYEWNRPLHDRKPFDRLFPYEKYSGKNVLEIGCGMGTMAMNWARNGANVTAVDLSPTSVAQTRRRFEIFGLEGDIHIEDANRLSFGDAAFDYAWSWGVLHHSPNLETSVAQMMRALKAGGGFGIMLYNRRSIWHWYTTEYVEGYLHYEKRFLTPLQLASRYADGYREEGNPHTWPVTPAELTKLIRPYSRNAALRILGTELGSLFELMLPGVGMILPVWAKKVWARRFGWSLWIHGTKD